MCRDDREKDRYGWSVTVPIWVRRRRQRPMMQTETGASDKHTACKCKIQKNSINKFRCSSPGWNMLISSLQEVTGGLLPYHQALTTKKVIVTVS